MSGAIDDDGIWHQADPLLHPRAGAFHLPSWYSTDSLSEVVAARIEGDTDPHKKMIYVTQYKAEEYNQVIRTTTQSEILKSRVDALPPQTVPQDALALVCFIDVQKYSCWFAVRAFARDYTSWLIHWGQLPSLEDAEDLIFTRRYAVAESAETMGIWRAGVDTGGSDTEQYGVSMTENTYWWLIRNIPRGRRHGVGIFGTKGSSRPILGTFKLGEEILKTSSGKKLPAALRLTFIDTEVMKSLFHDHLDNAARNEGRGAYLHAGTDNDYGVYLRHILAEEKKKDSRGRVEWVKKGRDNHLFDCEVGCMSLAHYQWPGGGVNMLTAPIMLGSGAALPRVKTRRVLSGGVGE
jgi:phage terminase large subunit GpA-like protein